MVVPDLDAGSGDRCGGRLRKKVDLQAGVNPEAK